MITNFDYLKKDSKFSRFADVAISAEKIILMDPEASILNSRRAMEFAIKWMYSVDSELEMPYQDNLQSLMNAEEYRQIVGPDLWKRMDYIRRSGNSVAHNNKKLGVDEAMLCLENLFIYLDYIAYCYSTQYEEHSFDKTIITSRIEKAKKSKEAVAATKNELEKEIFLHCLNRDTVSIPSICAHVEEILVSGRNQTTVHLVKHHFYFRIQRKVQLILRLMQGLWRRWRSIWDTMMLRCTENSMKM